MNSTDLTYGDADEVNHYLMAADDVTHSDLVGALANAMRRIAQLEAIVSDLKDHADALDPANE